MIDPRERFTATAEDYARFRPGYPREAIDWICATAGLEPESRVVDLGTGTGIVARLFAERGYEVIGVDPNAEMLAKARAQGGGPRYVIGEAAKTGLERGRAQLVVAAQAFHWFDLPSAMAELRRVLAPEGGVAAMWNVRGDTPFMQGYEAALGQIPAFRATPQPAGTLAAIDRWVGLVDRDRFEIQSRQTLDREGLFGRARSSSYVAHATEAERWALFEALDALFDTHAERGTIDMVYRTVVSFFRFHPVDLRDHLPDVRDGLNQRERVVLYVLDQLRRERGDRMVATAEIYGRVTEHVDMSKDELIEMLARMGARRW